MAPTVLETPCREYQGPRRGGYGRPHLGEQMYHSTGGKHFRKRVTLHRWIMEQYLGRKLDRWEIVRHRCDNPPCFRFDHLVLGTQADNNQDMVDRGRSTKGKPQPRRQTHCKRGHLLEDIGTRRICRVCRNLQGREGYRRRGGWPTRLAAQACPATVAAFQTRQGPQGEPEGLTLDSDG